MCMNPMPKPTFWQMQGPRSPQAEGFTLYEGIAWHAKVWLQGNAILAVGILQAPEGTLATMSPTAIVLVLFVSQIYGYLTCRALLRPILTMSPAGIQCRFHAQHIPWADIATFSCRKEQLYSLSVGSYTEFKIQIIMRKKKKALCRRTHDSRIKISPMGNISITLQSLPYKLSPQMIEALGKQYRSQAVPVAV